MHIPLNMKKTGPKTGFAFLFNSQNIGEACDVKYLHDLRSYIPDHHLALLIHLLLG